MERTFSFRTTCVHSRQQFAQQLLRRPLEASRYGIKSLLHQASHHRPKKPLLVPEIEVDRPLGDSGLPGDIVDAGGLVPMRSENFEGGRQDFLLTVQLLLLSARGGFGRPSLAWNSWPLRSLQIMTE